MTRNTRVRAEVAETIGRRAYRAGASRVPARDEEFGALVGDLPVGGGAAEIGRAFLRGWDAENFAAPVEEEVV